MAEKEGFAGRTDKSSSNLTPPEIASMGEKRVEDFVNAQTELLNRFHDANRHWFDRMQTEAKLASEFTSKMMGARSIPEAVTTCQEWASRHLQLMAEDGKRIVADTQKLMETSTRMLSNGWSGNGRGGSAHRGQSS
jgi:Phasin protein